MLMMLVDEPQRKRLENHSLVDRAHYTDEHLEHLFNVIRTMYKKNEGSPKENKKKFLRRTQRHDESVAGFAVEMRYTLNQAWPGLPRDQQEDLLIYYFKGGLHNQETIAKLRIEGPKTLTKAIYFKQIYEDLFNKNTNMIKKTVYLTPPGYSILETPASPSSISSGQPKIIKFMQQRAENFVTPTNPKSPQKSRTIMINALDMLNKSSKHRSLLLNNIVIQYIPNTGAAISVISEEEARMLNVEIKPYYKTRI